MEEGITSICAIIFCCGSSHHGQSIYRWWQCLECCKGKRLECMLIKINSKLKLYSILHPCLYNYSIHSPEGLIYGPEPFLKGREAAPTCALSV